MTLKVNPQTNRYGIQWHTGYQIKITEEDGGYVARVTQQHYRYSGTSSEYLSDWTWAQNCYTYAKTREACLEKAVGKINAECAQLGRDLPKQVEVPIESSRQGITRYACEPQFERED